MPIKFLENLTASLDAADLEAVSTMTEDEARSFLYELRPVPDDMMPVSHQKKERTKDLSIIIPAHNVEKFISKCLSSVLIALAPLDIDAEILIAENDSTDNTRKIIENFGGIVRLLDCDGITSVGAAKNRALDEAEGRYLMFVDADDSVLEDSIGDMWRALITSGADIVAQGFLDYDNDGAHPLTDIPREIERYDQMSRVTTFLWGKIYKAELFDELRCPEGLYYDNTIPLFLIYPRVKNMYLLDGCGYVYHRHKQAMTNVLQGSTKSIDTVWMLDYCLGQMAEADRRRDPITLYRNVMNHYSMLSWSRVRKMEDDVREAVFVVGACTLEQIYETLTPEEIEQLPLLLTEMELTLQTVFRNRHWRVWDYMCRHGREALKKREEELLANQKKTAKKDAINEVKKDILQKKEALKEAKKELKREIAQHKEDIRQAKKNIALIRSSDIFIE